VNWSIVRVPKSHGGMGNKDHSLMNLAMGFKLLWRLISGKYDLWKKIIQKKYFEGHMKRCLDNVTEIREGSHIWKLLKATLPIFK
jgi:hypothetical protein